MNRHFIFLLVLFLVGFSLTSCDKGDITTTTTINQSTTTINTGPSESEIYQLLIETEKLSGMSNFNGVLISESLDLGLPTEYKGVIITYSSRNQDIINNQGIVTLPNSCWIESRKQDGITAVPNLNDNWPVVVDVTMEFMGQIRTAKLMFLVAPEIGFSCNKYLG